MGLAGKSATFMRRARGITSLIASFGLLVSLVSAMAVLSPLQTASATTLSQYAFDFNTGASNTVMKTADGTRVIPASGDFTVEAWVYVDSDTGAWQTILVQDQAAALMNPGRFYLGFFNGRNLHIGAGNQSVNTTVVMPLQTWTHVAVSVDRTGTSTRTITYINGSAVYTWDYTSVDFTAAQGFAVGLATDGGYELDGKVDQVKVWNGALSSTDIARSRTEYAAGGITSGTLAAHYDFNEGTGSTITDRSGNNLNLALTTGNSVFSQTPTPPNTTPAAPSGVAGTAGNTQVALTWSAPTFNGGPSITGYTVTSSPSVTAPAGCTNTANLACTFTGLTNGTAYTFSVVAINSVGNSAASTASSSVTPLTTAGPPTSLSATVGNSQVALSWTAPTSNGGSAITDYLVQYSTDGTNFTTFADGVSTTPSATVTGMVNGTAYTFRVSTVTSFGTGTGATVSPTPFASCSPASSVSGGFTTLTFTSSTTCFWSVPAGVTAAHVVAVGGGGGGGADGGGGGGGGGVYENTNLTVTPNAALMVAIGQGGAGGNGYKDGSGNCTSSFSTWSSTVVGCDGARGTKTFFGTISASGGGGGGGIESSGTADFDSSTNARGGGGGAGAQNSKAGTGSAGVGGFTGGSVSDSAGNAAGGGAGAGANGSASNASAAGAGGAGVTAALNSIVFGSGGGGGSYNNATAALGGANAANGGSQNVGPTTPTANRGGGGGGGGNGGTQINAVGSTGAAGVVIVKYLSTYTVTYNYNGANAGNATTSATFTPGSAALTLPTPSRTGFAFSGWYTASTGGSLVGSGGASYTPSGTNPAITLEAQWGAPSGVVNVPSSPSSVTASGASGGIQVTWAAPVSLGGQTITAYQVEYSTTGAANAWTVASSSIASNATSYTITGLTGNTSYYIRIAALYSGGRGAYGYPWKKVYGTVTTNRDGSNLITYQAGFGTTSGDAFSLYSSFTRVRYLMKATYGGNNNYVDADFLNVLQNPSASTTAGFSFGTITNLRVPSIAVGQQFVAQGDVYDLTVLAPSTVSVQNGYGFNGRVEIWPWDYGVAPTSGVSTRAAGTYDDGDSLTAGNGWYGSFQLHNLTSGTTDYRQTIFAWNNHNSTSAAEIGFGNNAGTHSDWTFCSGGGTCASRTNFSLEVFINPPVVASSVPGSPTGVSATAGNTQASVSWSAPASNGGSSITGYTVTSSPSVTAPAGCTNTANLSCTFSGLTNGTSYTFTVVAINAIGSSVSSSASSAVIPATTPGAPTSVTATTGNTQASISWTAPASNGGATITGYTVTSSPSVTAPAGCSNTLNTSCTFTGLTNGTAYTFTVTATNSVGDSSASTASSSITPRTTPGAPTGVTATLGNTQASISWTAPASNGGSSITGYTVTSSPSVTAPSGCTNTLNTSCTFTGLTNGTAYTFTVVAINAAGSSSASIASSSITPATTSGAPTGATATAGFKRAVVSWTAPASNGGSIITGYTVTSSPSVTAPVGCTNTTNLSCTFTGLTAGTAYTFTVVAINSVGNSNSSSSSSSVTPFGDCVVTPTSSGGYKTYVFTTVGLCGWTVPTGTSRIETVAVGGGGGAAFGALGGGGGGGRVIVADSLLTVSPGDVVIIKVGKGGNGGYNLSQASWTVGSNGDPSSITVGANEYSASGGGAGGGGQTPIDGLSGGSGGGGAGTASPKSGGAKDSSTISGFTAYGNNGGTGNSSAGGGGGGAGTAGGTGGAGGNGISIWGVTLAGGGGGWASGTGGTGGGGASGNGIASAAGAGTQGTDGLGGGGGGGQKGGTGRVMIRFIEQITITPTVSPTSIAFGSSTSIATSYTQSLAYTLTTNPTCEIYSDAQRTNRVSTNGAISGAAASALSAGTYYVNCTGAVATDGPTISYGSDATFTITAVTLTTVTTPTLAATSNTAASLTASWTSVSNASSYTVKVYPGAGGSAVATITNATSPLVINSNNYSGIAGATSYKVSVTAIASGSYVNATESTQSSAVTTLANPTITSISASSGAVVGGATTITIGGTNLSTTSGVTIGNVSATVVAATNTLVTLSIPAATITGSKDLVLTTSVSTATVSNSYVDCGTSGNFFVSNGEVTGAHYCVGTVVVPDGVTGIGVCGFANAIGGNCGNIKGNNISTVQLPSSIRIIRSQAFGGSNMTAINLPEGLTTIGNSAFYIGGTYSLHIPSTVTSINSAFYKTNAKSITFASGSTLSSISDGFRLAPNLFTLALPDSVTTIVGTLNFASSFATLTMRGVTTLPAGSLPTTLTCIVTSSGNTAVNSYSYTSFTTPPLIVTNISSCPQPTITSLSVVSGSTSGSTSTVISGTNLINTTGVTFGGNAATITAKTTTSVTVTTPAGSAGAADVVVTTEAGSVTRSNGFTYLGATISITYDSQGGTSVTSGSTSVGGTLSSAPTAPTRTNYLFSGWSTTSTGSVVTFPFTHAQTANFTLYAIWTGSSLTLTYDSQGGSSVSSITTAVGATISAAPAAPTKTSYTFAGWSETVGGTAIAFPYTHAKTSNFTLYAKWSANSYTLTYVYNSATGGNSTTSDSFTTGGTQITLPTPTRTGHTFAGWFAESTFVTSIGLAGASFGPTGSSLTPSAYAKWTAINYTVTYATTDSTGGAAPTDSTNYNIGNTVSIKGNTGSLVRSGYTFTGWTAASDGTGTLLTSGSPFTVASSNMTFYPKWSANTYTISYNANGASGSPTATSASYTSGSTAVTLTSVGTMTKTGFDFNGWSTTPSGSGLSGTFTTTTDVTLYAIWTIKSITINFSKGDASASSFFNFPNSRNANYGTTITLSDTVDTAVTIGGISHAFMGWNDGTSVYQSGATYILGDSSPTFTAIWVKVFAVRYAFNGGTAAVGSSAIDSECLQAGNTCTDGQVITANAAPTRAGYTFAGWVDQNNASVTAGGSMTVSTTRYLIYANWTPIDYTISYNTDGGSTAPTSFTKRIGETFLVANAPTKTGYRFSGWSDGSLVMGAGATYYVATSPVTLTAQWTANVYTVTFDWNGGTGTSTSDVSYTVGSSAITLPLVGDHVKDGYTFSGWSETANGSLLSGGYSPTADTTLYAIWGTGSYTTTYSANGGTVGTSSEAVQNGSSITLPTPTRSNFVFEGWYTASTGGTKVGNAGASHQPTQSRTLHARWTQASLYGLAPSALTRIGTTTASSGSNSTFSSSNANSSVSVTVPAGALPNGTTVNFDLVGDFTRAQSVLTGNNSYIISLVVSWLATDGTVPNTASGKPIAVTISNASIKAGMSVYAIVAGNVTTLGTASTDGTVTVNLTSDPEVVVVATKPNSPTNVAATSNGIKQAVISWIAPASDGGSTITGYTATSNTGATCTTSSTSCTITGLSDATAYTFTVTAANAQGNSSASSSASATTASNYTVTFNSNGGTSVTTGSFFTGSTVAEPTAPTRAGYTFSGWASVDGGAAENFPFAPGVSSNITMYARWTGVDNTVTFDAKGGSSVASSVFASGSTVAEPTAPTKTGYTFDGWSATDGGTVVTFPYSPGVITAITLYAKWSAASNAVTFDSKGGSSVTASTFLSGGSVNEPTAPTKANYTFDGWSATDGGTAVTFPYSPGVVNDITLYARWTAVSQSSSGGGGGGSSSPAPSTPTPSEPVVPVVPFKGNVTVIAPVTVIGDTQTKVPSVDIGTTSSIPGSKPPAVKVDAVSEKFVAEVKIVDGKLLLTPETGFSGKKTVTVTITENGVDRFVQIPLTVLPEAVTKPVLTPTASNKSIIRWSESPNADGYTVYLNGKKVCSTSALSCSVKSILGPDAVIEIVANGGDKTVSQRVDAEFKQNAPVSITRLVSATITKATLTKVDTKALDKVVTLIKNQGFGTVVISEITTTSKTKALAEARIAAIKKYIDAKTGSEKITFEVVPPGSRTYFNNIAVKG